MRENSKLQNPMFFVANTEERLPKNHPLRVIKRRADEVLKGMERAFDSACSETGRPGIPPEALLKALLLQALYSIPSERRLAEAINWNLLCLWFCDLEPDTEIWDATAFTHKRERFERHGLVQKSFERVAATALVERFASNDHFAVDGTLIQSWTSLKSFRPKDEPREPASGEGGSNPSVNFRGERRRNETHRWTTDPEARLARKSDGQPALLSHSGHALVENRHGLRLEIAVAEANGHAERDTAEKLLRRFGRRHGVKPKTVSADRGYEAGEFLRTLEEDLSITPQVPITTQRVTSQGPATATPASASFKTPMICSSLNRLLFIISSPPASYIPENSHFNWSSLGGAGQADPEMTTGQGHIPSVGAIVIEPGQPLASLPAQIGRAPLQAPGAGHSFPFDLHRDTLHRVSTIMLNEDSMGINSLH